MISVNFHRISIATGIPLQALRSGNLPIFEDVHRDHESLQEIHYAWEISYDMPFFMELYTVQRFAP